jgi:hypothetical protein
MTQMGRNLDEFGEAEVVQLATTPAPPPQRRRRVVPILRSEAAAAGTTSDLFNLKVIRETVSACTTMDDPDLPEVVAETIAGLKDIAPTNAREAMLAAQLLATHTAVMDSLGLARTTTGLLSEAHSAMPSGLPMPTPRCPRRLTAPGAATGGSLCWNTGALNARVA